MDDAAAADTESADVKRSLSSGDAADGGSSTIEQPVRLPAQNTFPAGARASSSKPKQHSRRKANANSAEEDDSSKRRCVSTACIACRKRKSKCDGNTPACMACSQVYGTDCVYDPNSDHRRKGVYKNESDNLKTRNSTLQTLIQAILNYPEDDVPALVREIRTCESLDVVAEKIAAKENGEDEDDDEDGGSPTRVDPAGAAMSTFESHLYGKMGNLRLDEGSVRYIGGTSNLIHLAQEEYMAPDTDEYLQQDNAVTSWTDVTNDPDLVMHLVNMYFTWHYTFFTTLSKQLFFRDFMLGQPPVHARRHTHYCTPLLVNAILALGCHFTSHAGARDDPEDSATAGDHFFREAKRLIMENDEHERPRLTTVQALALMSVREAGCGREGRGWVYSGMSFRMACDMGLNLDSSQLTSNTYVSGDENEEDVRRVTFWGCYLFDKCWSNYLGRLPQLPSAIVTASKYDVFPEEDSAQWSPYTDSGFTQAHAQPSRTRTVALQISKLCEISNDVMKYFYNPIDINKTKGKAAELKKLSEIHTRLEGWRRDLPKELEPKEGGLSSVLVMHMFFQLLFIHLFRPFLRYAQANSPLPSNVSPRKFCTQAAAMISKLMRLYKRSHGLRQIPNIAVYIIHSACTIHLLNLPDKNAKRDIVHGVKHLEEIAEGWLCARRTLAILSVLASKWQVDVPEEAAVVLQRTDAKFGTVVGEVQSPSSQSSEPMRMPDVSVLPVMHEGQQHGWQQSSEQMAAPAAYCAPAISNPSGGDPQILQTQPGEVKTLGGIRPPQHPPYTNANPGAAMRSWGSSGPGRTAPSPSDMFGGVEQLLRDSTDWAFRDQAQMAAGFGNWNQVEVDSSPWSQPSAVTNGATQIPAPVSGPVGGQAHGMNNGVAVQNANMNYTTSPNAMDTSAMTNWLNSMNAYNNMAGTYDEEEWYQ